MEQEQQAILAAIEEETSGTKPYTSAKQIAERLIETLEDVESQLQVMESNGLVRLSPTTADFGQWDARLTTAGRRQLGLPEYPSEEGAEERAVAERGNAGAATREEIAAVEAILANVLELARDEERGIGEALRQLANAASASRDLSQEEQERTLETLLRLSEQAVAAAQGQTVHELEPTLAALKDTFIRSNTLAKTWAIWEGALVEHFDV